jgi:hypothetical protein
MTSTTFFPGSSPSSSTAQRSAPRVNKAQAIQAPRAVISAVAAYPWMTQTMLARMSPRARRLLRADY